MDAEYVRGVLSHHALGLLQLKPLMGTYVWLTQDHLRLPCTGRFLVTFEAQATNDIHVSFNKDCSQIEGRDGMSDRAPNYEIVLGGWMNSKTAIRKHGQQQAAVRKEVNPEAVVISEGWHRYWVVLDNGLIAIGRGDPGLGEILRWKDASHEFLGLRYVGFSSWDRPIQYREIAVSPWVPALDGHKLSAPGEAFFLNNPTFSDAILEIPTTDTASPVRFFTHKSLLARRSRRMRQLLTPDSSTSEPQVLQLPSGTSARHVELLLRFLYCGSLPTLKREDVESGLAALARSWSAPLFARCAEAVSFAPTLAPTSNIQTSGHVALDDTESEADEIQFGEQIDDAPAQGKEEYGEEEDELDGEDFEKFLRQRYHDVSFLLHDPTGSSDPIKIPAHRALLAAASEPLYAMLGKGYSESRQAEVGLHDVSTEGFRMLLRCIYTRRQPIFSSIDDVLPLLFVADRFDVFDLVLLPTWKESLLSSSTPPASATPPTTTSFQSAMPLVEFASKVLEKNLDLKNCCLILQMAGLLKLGPLQSLAMKFIEVNFDRVAMTKGFRRLEAREVLEIVTKDSLVVSEEERVFEALLRWGEFNEGQPDATSREQAVVQLLMFIRFPLMDPEYLSSVALSSAPVVKDSTLNSLVRDVHTRIAASAGPRVISTSAGTSRAGLRTSGTTSDTAFDFRWRPRTPRSLHQWKELSYSGRGGDECGVFYWIGTNYGRQTWGNPHKLKKLTVVCSSPPSRYSSPELIVDRGFHTTWYTSGRPAWIEVELGKGIAAVIRGYTLRQDGSTAYPRRWRLQGSNDRQHWDDLSVHENDCSLAAPGQWAYWPVAAHRYVPYSLFRLELTGPNASPVTPNILAISNLELYGFLNEGRALQG